MILTQGEYNLLMEYHPKTNYHPYEIDNMVILYKKYINPNYVYKACCKRDAGLRTLKDGLYSWFNQIKNEPILLENDEKLEVDTDSMNKETYQFIENFKQKSRITTSELNHFIDIVNKHYNPELKWNDRMNLATIKGDFYGWWNEVRDLFWNDINGTFTDVSTEQKGPGIPLKDALGITKQELQEEVDRILKEKDNIVDFDTILRDCTRLGLDQKRIIDLIELKNWKPKINKRKYNKKK